MRGRRRESPYTDLVLLRRLAQEARPYRLNIAIIFVLSMLAAPLVLLTPVPLAIAVDSVIGSNPFPGFLDGVVPAAVTDSKDAILIFTAVMFLVVAVLTQVQDVGTTVLKTYTGEKLVLKFQSKLFQQSQRLSLAYHDRVGTSDSTYRVREDAKSLQYIAVESLISLITAFTTLAAMLYVTARIDLQLALVAVAITPLLLLTAWHYRPRMRSQSREVKILESGALSVVQEVLTGLRMVKAFGQEEREQDRFVGRSGAGMRARIRLQLTEGAYALLVGAIIGVGGSLVLFVGTRGVQQGRITLGELLLVMGYLTQLYAPIKMMARKAGSLQNHLASAERCFALLDEAPEVPERPDARPLDRARGAVEFRDVSFAYGSDRPVLEGVSFTVEPGARVGIAGATGAGKTTLMSLLARFYDPRSGQILLDGVDLRDYRLADVRRQLGIVLQEPVLFSTTIYDNIAYARPDATQEEIEAAAAAANIDDFIETLPEGYATEVGERGMRLSGGERQRISLARAFLKNAPILILDEPTSSVDVKTEAMIMEAMERLMIGRTSFMIAHRLGTLEGCDVRLQVDRGRIATATYPPDELRARQAPRIPKTGRVPAPAGNGATATATVRPEQEQPSEYPAVRAWLSLATGPKPRQVRVLKAGKPLRKSAIYRLDGAGPGDSPVIAKLCRRKSAEIESLVYGELLPHLPSPTLRYYGSVPEGDGECCWLFLEDAGIGRYSPVEPEHRRLAGRWLASVQLHAELLRASDLPERGASHYLVHLVRAREAIVRQLGCQETRTDAAPVLEDLLCKLDAIESHWEELTAFCSTLPRTLVHGDLVPKNLSVTGNGARDGLAIFDWETAGLGIQAPDLAQLLEPEPSPVSRLHRSKRSHRFSANPCLETYRSELRGTAAELEAETIDMVAAVGNLFRCLAGIDWTCASNTTDWCPVDDFHVYSGWLGTAMEMAGLTPPSRGVLQSETKAVDEREMLAWLEQDVLPGHFPNGTKIAPVDRATSSNGSPYSLEHLRVSLENGNDLKLYLKHSGFSRLRSDGAEERYAREIHLYKDLLSAANLGTPTYYGSLCDEDRNRFLLLLEFVEGPDLRSCDFSGWTAAARWLARMHGFFACHPTLLSRSDMPERHDSDYFGPMVELAIQNVRRISGRAARRLSDILADQDAMVALLRSWPVSLAHGNYEPRNIIVNNASHPSRVCVVDWESAAIGSTLHDLALLAEGYLSPEREVLLDAYGTEATASGMPVPDLEAMSQSIDCLSLHTVVRSLSRAPQKRLSEHQISELIDIGERLQSRIAGKHPLAAEVSM